VIPPSVEMTGTIRTYEPEVRTLVIDRFEKIVHSVADAMSCQAEINIQRLTPATINQVEHAVRVASVARELFPDADVDQANYITMGSEDFAYILEKVPGCFFFVGSANPEKGLSASHHHPKFDIDETALPRAAALMAGAIMEYLK
jgi:metal-dependent amidase/aminoacylase/carboxypeptidase family protein